MANRLPVVVPAVPPKPPQLSLLNSAIRPDKDADPPLNDANQIMPEQLAELPADLRSEIEARKGAAWTRGITYAPENHFAAILRDPCDTTTVDLNALPAPSGLTLKAVAGGTIAAGTYGYQITAVNANGETTAKAKVEIVTGSEGSIKLTWTKVSETAEYKIYGREAADPDFLVKVGPFDDDQAAEWVDNGSKTATSADPPVSNTTGGTSTYTNLAIVTAIPYEIEVEDYCSTFGFEMRDFKGRAERLLENAQHSAIEAEFWSGALARAKSLPNNYLIKENTAEDLTPEAGAPSIERGFEILQDALQQCGFGGQGMLHVQAQTAPSLLRVRRVGPLLYDMFDNIVVPGVGYPGKLGPIDAESIDEATAGKAWMFASDLVACRVEDEPTIFTETYAEATDWGQGADPNSIRMRARKLGIAYMDAACVFACEVTLAT